MLLRKVATTAAVALLIGSAPSAQANDRISDGVVRIGLLLDMSSLYADVTGPGSALAARMAVEDFGGRVLGKPIEVLVADHQNKADIASAKAREWFDSNQLDAIGDVAASAPALAVMEVVKQRNKIALLSAPATSKITSESCIPNSVHYVYDTYAMAHSTGHAVVT